MTGPDAAAPGVYSVDWVPGTDLLRGTCHCGASADAGDPVRMWAWLLAHPRHPARPGDGR